MRKELAPCIRVFEHETLYFCSTEHAEDFDPSQASIPERLSRQPAEPVTSEVRSPRYDAQPPLTESTQHDERDVARADSTEPHAATSSSTLIRTNTIETANPSDPTIEETKRGSIPLEFVPLGLLAIATLTSLLPVEAAAGQFGFVLPLTWAGSLLLLVSERHALGRAAEHSQPYIRKIRAALSEPARVRHEHGLAWTAPEKVRLGQELHLEPGETAAADATITAGEGEFVLPGGAQRRLQAGQTILAGSRLISGTDVVARAQRVGPERALSRLVGMPQSVLLQSYFPVRFSRMLAYVGAPVLGLSSIAFALALDAPWLTATCIGCAVWTCLSSAFIHSGCYQLAMVRLIPLEERGTLFPQSNVLALAGNVGTAVFCARGTVQRGQPEVAEVHALRDLSRDEVLGLTAGALSSVHHPIAEAVLRTAQDKGIAPHACRSHNPFGGANMRCRGPDGREVIVGGREFLLRERISIAWVEERLRAIEAQAQTVLLVATDDELVGVLALADDLAPGARATMQRLLTSGIEPALLSGDSRETTEALARRLHIDHVRPEAKPGERRKEVEKLRTAGLPIAVIGRLGVDDASLLGSDLPVLMGGMRAYSPTFSSKDEGRSIAVWSGQLLDAGEALVAAHSLRRDTVQFLLARIGPTLLGVAAVALVFVPPVAIPLLSLGGFGLAQRLLASRASSTQDLGP